MTPYISDKQIEWFTAISLVATGSYPILFDDYPVCFPITRSVTPHIHIFMALSNISH